MSEDDRNRWEAKHARNVGSTLAPPLASSAWIPQAHGRAFALDLACGRGRHCRVLRDRGYRVVAVDIAAVALCELRRLNSREDASILALQADLETWPFARDVFDLVLQCDFLERSLFDSIKHSVRPGGYVLVDTFCGEPRSDRDGPRCAEYRLRENELLRVFYDWEIVRTSPRPESGRDALLARKPARL